MSRPAHLPGRPIHACLALLAPAVLLSACSSREDEIAERNAQLAEQARSVDAKRHATRIPERKSPAPSPKNLARQETLADFYGHGDDGGDGEDKNKKGKNKKAAEPDFLDPTSDYYDNTYVVPEPVSFSEADAAAESNGADTTTDAGAGADPEA